MTTDSSSTNSMWALFLAIVLVMILPNIPVVSLLALPLTWLGTLVHETGHALGALAVGGKVSGVEVFVNGSGVAHSSLPPGPEWRRAVTATAGLVGPAVFSMLLLWAGAFPRLAKVSVFTIGVLLLAEAVLLTQGFATPLAIAWGLGAIFISVRLSASTVRLATLVLAVQLALGVYRGSGYLFTPTAYTAGGVFPSDVSNVSTALGGSYLFWGVAIGLLDIVLLGFGIAGFYYGNKAITHGGKSLFVTSES